MRKQREYPPRSKRVRLGLMFGLTLLLISACGGGGQSQQLNDAVWDSSRWDQANWQ